MRKIGQFLWVLIIFNTCSSISSNNTKKESFEGVITYKITMKSKKPSLKTEYLQTIFGNEIKVYFKNGNVKFEYNGDDVKLTCYLEKTNIEYTLRNNIDTLFTIDCSNNNPKLLKTEVLPEKETILGRQCSCLFFDCGDITKKIYYDSTIYINPKFFEKHLNANWDVYFQVAKSPWLKYVLDGKAYTMTTEAIKIEPKKLNDSIFKLPKFPEKAVQY